MYSRKKKQIVDPKELKFLNNCIYDVIFIPKSLYVYYLWSIIFDSND